MRLLNILLGHVAIFGIAAAVSSSCTVNYPVTAFRCSPGGTDPSCPSTKDGNYICCSDDPTALLITETGIDDLVTPDYQGRGGEGTPIFSGGNNPLSKSGMCVKEGSVPVTGALADANASGCPVPCNPTWNTEDIESVCGDNTICCQTVELDPADCVLDPLVGSSGCWRPATGYDIEGVGTGSDLTNWGGTAHRTHQDPSGTNCEAFVAGIPSSLLEEENLTSEDVKRECYRRLTVANQRGFCLGGADVNFCPLAQPAYRDACEQKNDAEGRSGCDSVEFP
ncbi:MAG TPA: hypothetical protein VM869_00120 [Enhygromyxa sp.]|nr:hypothetical protein [Enhygromyxa sp.]